MDITPTDLQALSHLTTSGLTVYMLYQLLGPTAKYLGGRGPELAERACANLGRVFEAMKRKVGADINKEGTVPPRVLKAVVTDGEFCEDAIAAEYLGGVLASSRTDSPRDDRGVRINALISRLSVYQLRTHYLIYHAIKDLCDGMDVTVPPELAGELQIRYPLLAYLTGMGFSQHGEVGGEPDLLPGVMAHVCFGLHQEGLIDHFQFTWERGRDGGLIAEATALGIELFLWAHGKGTMPLDGFLDPAMQLEPHKDVLLIPGYNRSVQVQLDDGTNMPIEGYTYSERSYGCEHYRCLVEGEAGSEE